VKKHYYALLKIFSKTNFLLLSGLLLVATASLDPIVHDHFSEESSEITCQFYNNELTNLLSACSLDENFYVSNVLVSEKKIIVLPQDQKNFQSRAPPKI
jgi:hypothetical protein